MAVLLRHGQARWCPKEPDLDELNISGGLQPSSVTGEEKVGEEEEAKYIAVELYPGFAMQENQVTMVPFNLHPIGTKSTNSRTEISSEVGHSVSFVSNSVTFSFIRNGHPIQFRQNFESRATRRQVTQAGDFTSMLERVFFVLPDFKKYQSL